MKKFVDPLPPYAGDPLKVPSLDGSIGTKDKPLIIQQANELG
jgi:hypothetical protein